MTRRAALTLLAAAACAGCAILFPTRSYRFRLTIEVDTPDGLRIGSGVLEIAGGKDIPIGDGSDYRGGLIGQAVPIDLPTRTVYVLLEDVHANGGLFGNVTRAFVPEMTPGADWLKTVEMLGSSDQVGRSTILPRDKYPTLVAFENELVPSTVFEVDPDDLTRVSLGARLRRIVMEVTRDDITWGLSKRLPWLLTHVGSLVRFKIRERAKARFFGANLTRLYFTTNIKHE